MRWPEDKNEKRKFEISGFPRVGAMARIEKPEVCAPSGDRNAPYGEIVALKCRADGSVNNCLLLNRSWRHGHNGLNAALTVAYGAADADYPNSHWWVDPGDLREGV